MPRDGVLHIDVPGYGSRRERCDLLDHGINIYGNGESATRYTVYPYNFIVSSGSFEFTLVFRSASESNAFSRWTEAYLRRAASGAVGFLRPWRVSVPSRDFEKIGIPQGVTYGEKVGQILYKQQIRMKGTSSPVEDARDVSRLVTQGNQFSTRGDPFTYPTRPQLVAERDTEESLFLAEDLLFPLRNGGANPGGSGTNRAV